MVSTKSPYVARMADPLSPQTINEMVAQQFPGSSGTCIEVGERHVLVTADVDPDNLRPGGFVSGPTQFSLIDMALWFVSFVGLGRIEPMALTSELSVRFLRPAIGERLVARATLESVTRRSVVGTVHVWVDGEPERVTATAQGTYAVPLPR